VTSAGTLSTIHTQDVDLELFEIGSGPPLLYLHGGAGPQPDAPFLDLLSRHFHVLAPSHPGFGHSSLPDAFDSVDDLAFFYLDLLDHLGQKEITLIGHSLGGWIAAEIAVRSCQRLSRLVLVDPIGIKLSGRDTPDIADFFAASPERLAQLRFHDPPPAEDLSALSDEELAIIARNNQATALFTWEPFAHNPKLRSRLHRITVPTVLIWGASDGIVTTAYGEGYRDAIPGATLEIIAEAGHLPHYEQADEFVRRVLEFTRSGA
jgi:pimeloyl-ACP methyl ester carboxylesterase